LIIHLLASDFEGRFRNPPGQPVERQPPGEGVRSGVIGDGTGAMEPGPNSRPGTMEDDTVESMPKRIAIVEDEAELAALIDYNLCRHGYEAQVLGGAKGTLKALESSKPDLILLDVMLPEVDGFELCRQMRQSPVISRTPVLFLTARSDEVDRVLGLEIGGDDYMTKPFSPRELIARVKAHLRREEMDAEPGAVEIGPFRLDRTAHRVFLAGRELSLTSTEFNLLDYFLAHPGRAYSRSQLLEAVWGEQRYVTPRTVDVHVRRLREQIEEQPDSPRFLTTVRGFGYRFEEPS
jgi:DNA-binding response OmpR family regulator